MELVVREGPKGSCGGQQVEVFNDASIASAMIQDLVGSAMENFLKLRLHSITHFADEIISVDVIRI